jgi:hypothetical protein
MYAPHPVAGARSRIRRRAFTSGALAMAVLGTALAGNSWGICPSVSGWGGYRATRYHN